MWTMIMAIVPIPGRNSAIGLAPAVVSARVSHMAVPNDEAASDGRPLGSKFTQTVSLFPGTAIRKHKTRGNMWRNSNLAVFPAILCAFVASTPDGRAQQTPTAGKAKQIAEAIIQRFPVSIPSLSDQRIENSRSFWVGVQDGKISLNRVAPENQMGRLDATIRTRSEEATAGFIGCAEFQLFELDPENETVG
jgi:hypothetical protein